MTIGEKIQKYRKDLGLSQEDLGQKLLLSRQTVSLWEKDQTLPTIDNLVRLSEIFGVSVDAILDREAGHEEHADEAKETYRFHYTEEDLTAIRRANLSSFFQFSVLFLIASVLMCAIVIVSYTPGVSDVGIGFAVCFLVIGVMSFIRATIAYKKTWRPVIERMRATLYQYEFFDHYLLISIFRDDDKVQVTKCALAQIEQIQQYKDYLYVYIRGQVFIINSQILQENSALYSFMYQHPEKVMERKRSRKQKNSDRK